MAWSDGTTWAPRHDLGETLESLGRELPGEVDGYRAYAKAAMQRRENLVRSGDELKAQLDDAKNALADAFEELKKVEMLDERDQARERAEDASREQADLDAIGLMRAGGARV